MRRSSMLTNNILGSILLVTVIVMEVNISLQQHCQIIVSSQTNYTLTGTEYRSFTTKDFPTCSMECKKDERCMSLNFHIKTRTCDLNTQTKESQPTRYKVRQNSIYCTNTAFRTPEPLKGTKELPAKSCLDILVSGQSVGTGVYWIDPANTGNPIQAFCDMTTDGGGWTTVKKTILQSSAQPPIEEIDSTYRVIASYDRNDKWIIPMAAAMSDILQKMGFHQMHFYCQKKSVGRVVSIMTKNNTGGQQVVRYFTYPTSGGTTAFPDACGSFDRLPEDTSILAQNCYKWGYDQGLNKETSKWGYYTFHGSKRLGTIPFAINTIPKHFYGYSANYYVPIQGYCDDDYDTPGPYNANDIWRISVR